MDIAVIIVAYNSANEINACLDSVLKQCSCDFEVVVVDNCSQDDTLEKLQAYGDRITTIHSEKNLGYGQGCNLAVSQTNADYLYLLNPDTELHGTDCLKRIVDGMKAHPEWGLAGTQMVDANGKITDPRYYQYPCEKFLEISFEHLPGDLAWLVGASMVISREPYQQIEGFDKNFFLYGDEVDLCLRLRKLGFCLGFLEDIVVTHIGGASEKKTLPYDYWIKKQHGLHNFLNKHYPRADVKRIIKRDLRKATYRRLTLKLSGQSSTPKYDRYQAIYDTSKQWLGN